VPSGATATRWVESLTVIDADVLASYDHPHFGRWPAVTTCRHGEGRVTCVGTVPGRDLARALAAWIAPASRAGWQGLPASVTATTGTSSDGRRVHIVHNWSWEPARVQAPAELSDVLTDDPVPAGTPLDLGPWDVRVLVSADTTRTP
jgi:beta-galactosidase